jgi:DNA-damage-inducible protein J
MEVIMTRVSTNINLDSDLKKSAQLLFADLGMDLTTAVTIFLKQAVRTQSLPFAVTKVPNEETLAALGEYQEMLLHPEKYKRYSSFKSALDEEK